jgi:hypothetical protein
MPFGSGLGTFVPIYAMFEKPADLIRDTYINHAHNDILEIWLTTGVLGLPLFGMFVAWVALRALEIWRSAPAEGADALDWIMVRAATLVIALLVAHSFVDYPLRTGAMMAVLSFACALLIEPPPEARPWHWPWLQQQLERFQSVLAMLPRWAKPEQAGKTPSEVSRPEPIHPLAGPSPNEALLAAPQSLGPAPALLPAPAPGQAAAPESGQRPAVEASLPTDPSSGSSLPRERRWGTDLNWPEEWSESSNERAPKLEVPIDEDPAAKVRRMIDELTPKTNRNRNDDEG